MPKKSSEAAKLPAYDLKAEREKRSLSQMETAKLLFSSQQSVARWEINGDAPPIVRAYWELYWKHNSKKAVKKDSKKPN